MRVTLLALLGIPVGVAHADPVEGSAFAGASHFREASGLGNSQTTALDATSPELGVRMTLLPWRTPPTAVGAELELSYTQGKAADTAIPILSYRGLVLVRLSDGKVRPHLEVGAGGATVINSTAMLKRDTDIALITGIGATIPLTDTLHLRADVRQSWMESQQGGWTAMYEFQAGVGGTFGAVSRKPAPAPKVETLPPPPVVVVAPKPLDNTDRDNDGIVDRLDRCPDKAEDLDQNEDTDGCPDLDDDSDGIADKVDKCPLKPENRNGFEDTDGCPDELPETYVAAFAAASGVAFEKGAARLGDNAKASLDKTAVLLMKSPTLRVKLTVHPDANTEAATALATKRLNAIKWYLTEQGVAAKQLETTVGAVSPAPPVLEVALATR